MSVIVTSQTADPSSQNPIAPTLADAIVAVRALRAAAAGSAGAAADSLKQFNQASAETIQSIDAMIDAAVLLRADVVQKLALSVQNVATAQGMVDAVAASAADFAARYLGAHEDDPLVDSNGEALIAGALYLNTTAKRLKIFTEEG